jgi:hypothetical protein
VDEARKIIERLERIEALQRTQAPAEELLGEVRLLLHEGEAWLAAEHDDSGAGDTIDGIGKAQEALRGCRARLSEREEAMPETAGGAVL